MAIALPPRVEVAVVGAGAAGLGVAGALRGRGVDCLILERSGAVGTSWRRRYDGLRLNTVRWMSGQPGMVIPREAGRWPGRESFVDYLERYAGRHRLDVRTKVAVRRIDRAPGDWRLTTSHGELAARFVVVATGYDHTPKLPDWSGREDFAGRLIHSSEYHRPEPFAGSRVLVVGMGNTGTEVAVQLLEGGAAAVAVSMRTPPNFVRRETGGVPVTPMARAGDFAPEWLVDRFGDVTQRRLFGDLAAHGIPPAPWGLGTEIRVRGLGPTVDSGFVSAVKEGRIELVSAVERFDGAEVVCAGGRRLEPDAVIAATGYDRGLGPLVGHLGVLTASGMPHAIAGRPHPATPGLYFNGYLRPLVGQLPAMARTSRRIARDIAAVRRRR